jgi:streptomycin 3"-adenylyltransferase
MRFSDPPVGGIEASTEGQIQRLLAALRDVLGGDILGVYLYGSVMQGGLRPRSDIDIMVVTTRRTSLSQKRRRAVCLQSPPR